MEKQFALLLYLLLVFFLPMLEVGHFSGVDSQKVASKCFCLETIAFFGFCPIDVSLTDTKHVVGHQKLLKVTYNVNHFGYVYISQQCSSTGQCETEETDDTSFTLHAFGGVLLWASFPILLQGIAVLQPYSNFGQSVKALPILLLLPSSRSTRTDERPFCTCTLGLSTLTDM